MKRKNWQYFKNRFKKIAYYISESISISRNVPPYSEILHDKVRDDIADRVNYYCKVDSSFHVSNNASSVGSFKKTKSFTYFSDLKKIVRYFPSSCRFDYIFGDVIDVPSTPSFVKSRPINDKNENSIIVKLNAIRHFDFYKDPYEFRSKISKAVWRGMVYHEHRKKFVDRYFDNENVDVGHNDETLLDDPGYKGFMSVQDQLAYRYIVSIEGKDVATNLKWAMASNSLVMMRKPRFETWFMEGTLISGVHYIELKDDFSDLEEKVNYYNEHVDEALDIIKNANKYVLPFLDSEQEKVLSLLVAKKYFELSHSL